jgi:iron(III) transport system substrate-binding protein
MKRNGIVPGVLCQPLDRIFSVWPVSVTAPSREGTVRSGFLRIAMLGLLVFPVLDYQASAASLEALVAGSKREGVINVNAPSALGPEAAQELGRAFNKKYGLNVKLNYFPTKGFTQDASRVITQSAMGIAPDWDLIVLTENLHADLANRKFLLPFDYKGLGVDNRAIQHENGSIAFLHGVVLPTYNRQALLAKDVPKRWEDLLDSKWNDGKLGVSDATYLFALLAAGSWGEEKTINFVRSIAKLKPFLGRMAEVYTRLELREVLVASMLPDNFTHRAKMVGAPIVHADNVEPVLILPYNVGVLKGAAHPNGGHLFALFMTTPEAQSLWDKYSGQTSAFVSGTTTYNFLKGKQTIFMGGQQQGVVERLSNEYSKILGFTR